MQTHYHQLPNGLTIIGEHSDSARTMAAGYFVRTGARDETPEVSGVSHFLEHMMFKGTTRRTPEDVNREFDEMGARYNAFTSEENTVYYGNVLPQFQPRLLDLLSDMMRPALRDEDFTMEKNVILEEIAMYQDQPQFSVFDIVREKYFEAHPLGSSVLGSTQSISDLTREQMQKYFESRYAANNLTLVLTGAYDWKDAVERTEWTCGAWNTSDTPRSLSDYPGRAGVFVQRPRDESGDDKFKRAHIALMAPGFAAQDARRYAAAVACEAVGAGDGSRLYWALVHPGIAEAAQIGHDANDGAGTYYGYLLADPARAQQSLDVLRDVLGKACREGLEEAEVERAKRRLASAQVLGAETPMGRFRSVGMNWLYRREQSSPEESLRRLLAVSTHEVNDLLLQQPFERATIAGLGPLDELL